MHTTRPFDLLAFDLDGTTVTWPKKVMPQVTAEAFSRAHDRGVIVVAATGRPLSMLHILADARWLDYCITLNGALVRRHDDQSVLFGRQFTPQQVQTVLEATSDLDASWFVFRGDNSYMARDCHTYLANRQNGGAEEIARRFPGTVIVDSVPDALRKLGYVDVYKMQCSLGDAAVREVAHRRLAAIGEFEIADMVDTEAEITLAGANKGNALAELSQRLGIDPARAVAFGDDGNDLSIAGKAGTFVAVANAKPEVLAAADEVCPSVEENGVATWIEAHLG